VKVKYIQDNGIKIRIQKKGTVYKYGLMDLNSKDFGLTIKQKDMEDSY
jgi:hypothetical protein